MKKILAVIAAVVLVATLSFGAVMLTSADPSPLKVTVSSETAARGESKDITIGFTNNNLGVCSAKFTVTFPSDLTMTKATFSKSLRTYNEDEESTSNTATNKSTTSPVMLNWVSYSQNITGDVVYATLTFKVADDATFGDKDIEISCASGDVFYYSSGTYADGDLKTTLITPDIVNGKITVACKSHVDGEPTNENVVPATCGEGGSYDEVIRCSICGAVTSSTHKTTPATGVHSYNDVVTPPTCTEKGYTTHTCTVCNDVKVDTYVDANGHTWGDWAVTTPAGCTEKGVETKECSVCHVKENRDIEAKGHTWGDWTVTTPAGCTEKGVETKECSVCHVKENRDIEAKGHTWGDWTVTTPAGCTEKGVETKECSVCHVKENRDIADKGHTWGDWPVTTPAGCTEKGVETKECSVCHVKENRDIEAKGHTWGDWAVTTPAGCTEKGVETKECSVCHVKENRDIAAKGHNTASASWEKDEDNHWKVCADCTAKVDEEAHNYKLNVIEAATTEKDGAGQQICKVCGYTKDVVLDKLVAADASVTTDNNGNTIFKFIGGAGKLSGGFANVVITVDGEDIVLSEDAYEITEDSVTGEAVLTIKQAALAGNSKLKPGSTYSVKITGNGITTTGEVKIPEIVQPAADNTTTTTTTDTTSATTTTTTGGSPKTADNDIAFLIIALLAVMGSSIFAGVTYRRKRNSK